MDARTQAGYVTRLEQYILQLQSVIRMWQPYVPQHVIRQSPAIWEQHIPAERSLEVLQPSIHNNSDAPASEGGVTRRSLALQAYIKRIPRAKDWTCSLKPPQRILDLIFQLNTSATPTKEQVIQPHPNIISVVQHFSEITVSSVKDSRILRLLAKYNKLIFCAICHVACCAGASKHNVDSAMKRLSNSHSSYLDQLRQGAAWQLEAINKLHENSEWGSRSGDILFDFPPAFESMRRWGKSQESMKTFVDTLNDRSYVEGLEHSAGMALSVPCILKCIFGNVVSLEIICNSCHCNFEIAQRVFLRYYMRDYGQNALDEKEYRSSLCSIEAGLQTTAEHASERSPKRRRTGEPNSSLASTPARPGSPASSDRTGRMDRTSPNSPVNPPSATSIRRPNTASTPFSVRSLTPSHPELQQPDTLSKPFQPISLSGGRPDTNVADQRSFEQIDLDDPTRLCLTEPAIPSFTYISAIPSLSSLNESDFQNHAEGLPSTPLDPCLPSFSQITGIPSPWSCNAPSPGHNADTRI